MRSIIILFFLTSASVSFSQSNRAEKDSTRLIQLTGIVITDSLYRVPYATVGNLSSGRGVIADFYGYFALVVRPGDTLEFRSLGYKRKQYIIPTAVNETAISLVQMMTEDTIMAEPVNVYPWPSREEFANAFVNMDLPDTELKRAQQRLSPQEMAFVGALLGGDGTSAYSAYRVQQNKNVYTRGQMPMNNLLNPASWAEFLQGIGTGKYQISQ
ncbi:carboxypeptidase-like regulatory domain-containing protein [Crocinitomix sp.]|nr:carboxypeptidase-like regulatory domain-containing protein [Crocinitomix sp.]